MSYDDYDDYSSLHEDGEGFSSQEEELQNLGGFQIEGADDPTADAADDWLSQNDPDRVYGNDIAQAITDSGWKPEKLDLPEYAEGESLNLEEGDRVSPDPQEGMATVSDLQLKRIMHMPTDVKIAIKAILSGERQGISVNKSYLSHGNLDAAASAFASTIGEDPVDFARRIKIKEDEVAGKVRVIQYNDDITGERLAKPVEYKLEGLVRDPVAIRTAYSMLSKTAEGYLAKGPGQSLAGQTATEEQQALQDRKEEYVWKALGSLAELYIPEETRQSNIYASRKEQVTNELVKRFMNQNLSRHGRKENVTLPLPAELDVMGLVPNASVWGGFTSPYGRLEYDEFISGREFPENISTEDRDALEFKLYGKVKPNLRKSLFPVGKGESQAESKRLMAKAQKRAEKVQKGLLQLYPNLAGESTGNQFLQGFYYTEENPKSLQYELAQAEKLSLVNELMLEGAERDPYMQEAEETSAATGSGFVSYLDMEKAKALARRSEASWFQAHTIGSVYGSKEDAITAQARRIMNKHNRTAAEVNAKVTDVGGTGGASNRAGMYGERGTSELSERILEESELRLSGKETDAPRYFADTDLGRYQKRQYESPAPEQRSAEWFAQRKGVVTASQAGKLLAGEKTQLKLTAQLAKERLGTEDEFFANDPMRQGTKFEEKVLASFMAQKGKGLQHEEAYFETRPDLPGIGASPDGMLYDKVTGEFEGLLELKLLQSSKSMEGALKRYNAQMQLQMLVTGAHQTHFYAMNAKTGDVLHEVVKADPELQEVLRLQAYKVSREAESLDEAGVAKLEEQIQSLPTGRKVKTQKEIEQEKALKLAKANAEAKLPKLEKEEDEPATVYDPGKQHVHGIFNESAGSATNTKLAQALESADQRERMKESTEAARALPEQAMDKAVGLYQMDKIRKEFVRKQQNEEGTLRAANIEAERAEQEAVGAAMAADVEEAYRQQVEAANKSSKALEQFNKAVGTAAQGLAQIGAAAVAGTDEGMETVRLAAEAGMETQEARGLQLLLTREGRMDLGDVDKTIRVAGEQTKKFRDLQAAAEESTRIRAYIAKSTTSENIREKAAAPDPSVIQNMEPQERIAFVQNEINKFSDPAERATVASMWGYSEMAVSRVDGDAVKSAREEVDEEGLSEAYKGIRWVREVVQEGTEALGSMGEVMGGVSEVGRILTGVGIAGATYYGGAKVVKGIGSAAKSLKTLREARAAAKTTGELGKATVKPPVSNATSLAKKLPSSAKFSPIGIAVAGGSMIAREVMDVEEGSAADSAMDIVEMAATGAAIGSLIPGVGTVVGGAVGGAIGVGVEAWEHFTNDTPALPSEEIGQIKTPTKGSDRGTSLNSNVEVKVEVSPDLIETFVDNNGDIYLDSDNSLDLTGGGRRR